LSRFSLAVNPIGPGHTCAPQTPSSPHSPNIRPPPPHNFLGTPPPPPSLPPGPTSPIHLSTSAPQSHPRVFYISSSVHICLYTLTLPSSPCRYAEAERRFKEALVEARAGFPPNDPHIPSALHYLAEFYRNLGQLDKAEPLYREVGGCGWSRGGLGLRACVCPSVCA